MSSPESPTCSLSSGSSSWDLSSLSIAGEDWFYETPEKTAFHIHLCAPVHAELWNIQPAGTPVDDVTAFVRATSGDRSIGSMKYNLTVSNSEPPAPVLQLTGPACAASRDGSQPVETTIRFVCSPQAEGGPVLISHYPASGPIDEACAYSFEWATPAACPTSGTLDHLLGDIGAIVVFVGMIVVVGFAWLIGVLLYNRFILKLSGRDLLPSLPTFSRPSMPSFGGCWPARGSSSRKPWTSFRSSSYSRISSTADEEDGLVGRFGLDSDDEDDDGEADAHPLEGDSRVWRSTESAGGAAPKSGGGGSGLINL